MNGWGSYTRSSYWLGWSPFSPGGGASPSSWARAFSIIRRLHSRVFRATWEAVWNRPYSLRRVSATRFVSMSRSTGRDAVASLSYQVRTHNTTGKIQELRQEVRSGQYQISPRETAARMLLLEAEE